MAASHPAPVAHDAAPPAPAISLLPEHRAAVYVEDANGNPRIDIVEFALPVLRR